MHGIHGAANSGVTLFLSKVCVVVYLETVLLCEALPDPNVSTGRCHSVCQIAISFCSVHVCLCLLHCKLRNMFCCGKLCALVLSLWDFIFYSCKRDDDIKIQRQHIKLGNNKLKKQFATTDWLHWMAQEFAWIREVFPKALGEGQCC